MTRGDDQTNEVIADGLALVRAYALDDGQREALAVMESNLFDGAHTAALLAGWVLILADGNLTAIEELAEKWRPRDS